MINPEIDQSRLKEIREYELELAQSHTEFYVSGLESGASEYELPLWMDFRASYSGTLEDAREYIDKKTVSVIDTPIQHDSTEMLKRLDAMHLGTLATQESVLLELVENSQLPLRVKVNIEERHFV